MRRRTFIAGAGLTALGWPSAAHAAPIGTGWSEISPGHTVHQPPGRTRHSFDAATGEHHFWLYDDDPSTFPGQDSGPRSELRFRNDYTSGQAQFECDVRVSAGAHRVCVMQVFGGSSWATAFMTLAMNTGAFHYYDFDQRIHAPIYDRWLRLNVVHDTGARRVHVFVNRAFRATFADHGPGTHYFKCGLYGRAGMAARNDVRIRNIRLYRK